MRAKDQIRVHVRRDWVAQRQQSSLRYRPNHRDLRRHRLPQLRLRQRRTKRRRVHRRANLPTRLSTRNPPPSARVAVVDRPSQVARLVGRHLHQRLVVQLHRALQRQHLAKVVNRNVAVRRNANEDAAQPLQSVTHRRHRAVPHIRNRSPVVRRRHQPRRDDQRQRDPHPGERHLQRHHVGPRNVLPPPAVQRAREVQLQHQQHRCEQEHHKLKIGLIRQVRDVRQQHEPRRDQRRPHVPPPHHCPRRQIRDRPHREDQHQHERQRIVRDAALNQRRSPVAHPQPQLRPTLPWPRSQQRVRQLHPRHHQRENTHQANRNPQQLQEPRPQRDLCQHPPRPQPDQRRHRQRRHLIHPVRVLQRCRHRHQRDEQQQQIQPASAITQRGQQTSRALESVRIARSVELVPLNAGHGRAPSRSRIASSLPAPSACVRSSLRRTVYV